MKNSISSPIHGLDIEMIDSLLPFENRGVWMWHVSFKKTGYGRWLLVMDIDIDERKIILSHPTNDNIIIDYWDGLDENDTTFLAPDYAGRIHAITTILNHNEEYQQLVGHYYCFQ